jgi:hypothetical protein
MTQTFHFMTKAWNIDAAQALLEKKPRKPRLVDISTAMNLIRTDQAYVDSIDLDRAAPIIVGTITIDGKEYWMPLDGWHRIRRAKDLGVKKLPAYVLTKKETDQVEVRR